MIIISQDRKTIVNFNAIETIQIDDNALDKTETEFEILANGETLGYYKTEERAKEVSQEIAKCYEMTEAYKVADEEGKFYIAEKNIIFKYEMPAE